MTQANIREYTELVRVRYRSMSKREKGKRKSTCLYWIQPISEF